MCKTMHDPVIPLGEILCHCTNMNMKIWIFANEFSKSLRKMIISKLNICTINFRKSFYFFKNILLNTQLIIIKN